MSEFDRHPALAGSGMMLFSAALFGYFGFTTSFNYQGINGQFLLFVAILDWTLKGSAIAFLLCGLIAFGNRLVGNLLYSVFGLISAVLLLVVAVLDVLDTQHTAISPLLLLLFAAWNGYGSWTGLQGVLAIHRARARVGRTADFPGPE